MRKLPSPLSVISADDTCLGMATAAPMIIFFGLMVKLTGTLPGGRGKPDVTIDSAAASLVLMCAVVVALGLAAIVTLRVARVRSLFDGGREVEAVVRKVTYYRGGRRQGLQLEFSHSGIQYAVKHTFLRSSKTPEFREGTRIPLLVNPDHPKRSIPRTLYGDLGTTPYGSDGRNPT